MARLKSTFKTKKSRRGERLPRRAGWCSAAIVTQRDRPGISAFCGRHASAPHGQPEPWFRLPRRCRAVFETGCSRDDHWADLVCCAESESNPPAPASCPRLTVVEDSVERDSGTRRSQDRTNQCPMARGATPPLSLRALLQQAKMLAVYAISGGHVFRQTVRTCSSRCRLRAGQQGRQDRKFCPGFKCSGESVVRDLSAVNCPPDQKSGI